MTQTLQLLSTVAFAVAGACLILAVFLWFFFKIPSVIGDLSGRTARKSIARIREANEKSGNKSYVPSKINAARGKITAAMSETGTNTGQKENPETGLLVENKVKSEDFDQTGILDNDATGKLESDVTGKLESDATGKLKSDATGKLKSDATGKLESDATGKLNPNATEKLDSDGTEMLYSEETGKLKSENKAMIHNNKENFESRKRSACKEMEIIEEVMIIHTEEEI